jgi:hypothetical protein
MMTDKEFIKWYCSTPVSQITSGEDQKALDAELSRRKIAGRSPEEIELHAQIKQLNTEYAALTEDLEKLRTSVESGPKVEDLIATIHISIRDNRDRHGNLLLKAWQLETERFPKYLAELKMKVKLGDVETV